MIFHKPKFLTVNVLHYIALHCIALHCITLHYITLHYITLHYITLLKYHVYQENIKFTDLYIIQKNGKHEGKVEVC